MASSATGASLRGDFGRIRLEQGCNVQDNCTLHSLPGFDLVIGPDGHIGHGAIIHSARIDIALSLQEAARQKRGE
jgi:phenylacetic acid degradation protein